MASSSRRTFLGKDRRLRTKKNISIHYKDQPSWRNFGSPQSNAKIFDLIKVDYIVKDVERVHDKLMEEAARIARTSVSLRQAAGHQAATARPGLRREDGLHFPTQMYDSYTAYEAEDVRAPPTDSDTRSAPPARARRFFTTTRRRWLRHDHQSCCHRAGRAMHTLSQGEI